MELSLLELEKLAAPELAQRINDLIKNDFPKLIQLLYRIDVQEQKLKTILRTHPNEDAGQLIASMIIERLAATKKARESFNKASFSSISEKVERTHSEEEQRQL